MTRITRALKAGQELVLTSRDGEGQVTIRVVSVKGGTVKLEVRS